ncbi:MAG: hypothetical protein ACT4NP_11065 [Pseudonocardiales bacterium]
MTNGARPHGDPCRLHPASPGRWYLQQVVALGDARDGLTDRKLRDRLLRLAGCAR